MRVERSVDDQFPTYKFMVTVDVPTIHTCEGMTGKMNRPYHSECL